MFTSRSFARKFGRHTPWKGRGYTPLWPWQLCFWLILVLSSVMILTGAMLAVSQLWKVTSVTVEGTDRYDPEVIAEASEIRVGESVMNFDAASVKKCLQSDYPLIRNVKIQRKLNGAVILKITEETHLYYTCHHSNYYLISAEDRTVLGVSSYDAEYREYSAMYLGLPEEARVRVGEKISFAYLPYEPVSPPEAAATYEIVTAEAEEEYAYVWSFLEAVQKTEALKERVTGAELSDRYDLYLIFDGYVKVRFGSIKELQRKLEIAVEIMEMNLDGSRVPAVVDVSDTSKSTFREDPDMVLPDWAA